MPWQCVSLCCVLPFHLAGAGQHRALAYLKCRVKGQQLDLEGLQVAVNGARGTVVAPPFLSRGFPEQQAGAAEGGAAGGPSEAELAAQREKEAAEEQRRAEKLAAMQARLAAFQAAQQQQGGEA